MFTQVSRPAGQTLKPAGESFRLGWLVNPRCIVKNTVSFRLNIYWLICCVVSLRAGAAPVPPTDWIDPDTGHGILRLSTAPDTYSLYFHQNSFTPEGDKFIFDAPEGIATVDLKTLGQGPPKVDIVVSNISPLALARRTRDVYFFRDGALCAASIDTHAVREIIKGRFAAINCDETFVVRTITANDPSGTVQPPPKKILPQRERMFADKLKRNLPLTREEESAARKEAGFPAASSTSVARLLSSPTSRPANPSRTLSIRLAESSPVFPDRSEPVALLSRRHLARGGPHLGDSARWQRPALDARAQDGHGNRGP